MATERRLQTIEETLRMLTELNQSVVAMLASHEDQLASLRETTNRLTEANGRLTEMVLEARQSNNRLTEMVLEARQSNSRLAEMLDEVREDTRMTRNLWVKLATRYGWLEDDDVQQ